MVGIESPVPIIKIDWAGKCIFVTLVSRRQRWEDACASLTRQSSLLGELQTAEIPSQKFKGG